MADDRRIAIFGLASTDERGLRRRRDSLEYARGEIAVAELKERVATFVESLGEIVGATPAEVGTYRLNEVTVSAEVSAKGTVSILGTGGELGGSGGMTFKFIRLQP